MYATFVLRRSALLCSLLLVVCTLASYPFAEVGINDDFSYIYSARHLAQTGHIAYFGWSSAMLGWQLILGAFFIKLFGFSFSIARASILFLAACTAFLLQRTSVRLGLNERNATFATLATVLSPLFIPLSFSFMTDISALFAILVCLYGCLRALQSPEPRHAAVWLSLAMVASTVLGTARQTGWLGLLVLVPSASLLMRRRKLPAIPLLLLWTLSIAFVFASLRWFSHQMYATRESIPQNTTAQNHTLEVAFATLRYVLELIFFLAPVTVAFLFPVYKRTRRLVVSALLGALFLAFLLIRSHSYLAHILLAPSATLGSYFTQYGILDIPNIGRRPVVFGAPIRYLFTLIPFIAVLSLCGFLGSAPPASRQSVAPVLSWRQLIVLLAPFLCTYGLFLGFRAISDVVFDRYLLPPLLLLIILLVRLYQDRAATPLPLAAYAMVALYAVLAIAGTHDLFAIERARLAAAAELRAADIPRAAFYGGFGYDGWTQIETTGYVDAGGINLPPSAPPYDAALETFKPCGYPWAHYFDAIHARYAISYDDTTCQAQSQLSPVSYRLWLPPYAGTIYIREVAPQPIR